MIAARMGVLPLILALSAGCTQKPSEAWKAQDGGVRCESLQHLDAARHGKWLVGLLIAPYGRPLARAF